MEARVWIGTKGRYNPLQQYERGILSLDGNTLTFRGGGEPVFMNLSEVEFGFPLSMSGTGFVMTVRGMKAYVWFYDPFAGRDTLIKSGDKDEATIEGAKSWFEGRRAAKPWLKTLRSIAH
jgi:hypothetical protein